MSIPKGLWGTSALAAGWWGSGAQADGWFNADLMGSEPAGVPVTISSSTGAASAAGPSAKLHKTIGTTTGSTPASGVGAFTHASVATNAGSATAEGGAAATSLVISATAGDSSAVGQDALTGVSIRVSAGNAQAAAATAILEIAYTIAVTCGDSSAEGTLAQLHVGTPSKSERYPVRFKVSVDTDQRNAWATAELEEVVSSLSNSQIITWMMLENMEIAVKIVAREMIVGHVNTPELTCSITDSRSLHVLQR